MRKLIEIKLANARNDLNRVHKKIKKAFIHSQDYGDVANFINTEQYLIGVIDTYENLLNCNELASVEQKAKAFDVLANKLKLDVSNSGSLLAIEDIDDDYCNCCEFYSLNIHELDTIKKALGEKNE